MWLKSSPSSLSVGSWNVLTWICRTVSALVGEISRFAMAFQTMSTGARLRLDASVGHFVQPVRGPASVPVPDCRRLHVPLHCAFGPEPADVELKARPWKPIWNLGQEPPKIIRRTTWMPDPFRHPGAARRRVALFGRFRGDRKPFVAWVTAEKGNHPVPRRLPQRRSAWRERLPARPTFTCVPGRPASDLTGNTNTFHINLIR